MNKLNGWLRLWVVLSLLWAVPMLCLIEIPASHSPTSSEYRSVRHGTARYEIAAPDGKRYEISAPDNSTEDQVMAYAQKQIVLSAEDGPWTKYQAYPETISGADSLVTDKNQPGDDPIWEYIKTLLGIAIAPPFILLGLGYATAWVRRGFRGE